MTEAAAEAGGAAREGASQETGMLVRLYRAFDLLFSVHARAARREAGADLRRIATGLLLFGIALSLLGFALILGHAAAVLLVERRFGWGYGPSIGAVAGADVGLALFLFLLGRARLATPVLTETRAMMKKAASVLRG